MVTRLFFHAAGSGLSNLPADEQSSLTADSVVDAVTVNRSMTTTIGSSQASLQDTSISGTNEFYFTRFVSPPLFQADIDANTWTYNFAAKQQQTAAGFPVTGTDQPVHVHCYVWRPGTGLVGTILDGDTASTVDAGGNQVQAAHHVTFTGSAVSSMQDDDVLIFEVWFVCNGLASNRTMDFYFDGTTVNTTDNATVSDHASFLETPEDLVLTPPFTLFERSANDSLTVNSATSIQIGRPVSESLTVTDAVSLMVNRLLTESITVADAVVALRRVPKSVSESLMVADAVARTISVIRSLSESLTINDVVARVATFFRSLSESLTVNDAVAGAKTFTRTLAESLSINDTVVRMISVTRTLTESLTVADAVVGAKHFLRNVSESLTVNDAVARFYKAIKSIAESLTVNDAVARMTSLVRTLSESLAINDAIAIIKTGTSVVNIAESLTVAASVVRKACRTLPFLHN